jgi:hypothetical protein
VQTISSGSRIDKNTPNFFLSRNDVIGYRTNAIKKEYAKGIRKPLAKIMSVPIRTIIAN